MNFLENFPAYMLYLDLHNFKTEQNSPKSPVHTCIGCSISNYAPGCSKTNTILLFGSHCTYFYSVIYLPYTLIWTFMFFRFLKRNLPYMFIWHCEIIRFSKFSPLHTVVGFKLSRPFKFFFVITDIFGYKWSY